MNIKEIKDSFYIAIKNSLLEFANTKNNKDIYAIVFDCDSENGMISLRYGNEQMFQDSEKDFEKYAYMYEPYGKYSLHGLKYDVGNFDFIDWKSVGAIKYFLDSYYYYNIGCYFGVDEPLKCLEMNGKILDETDLQENIREIWENMIIDCINQLKQESIGLDKTEDFIIFMCNHDISNKEMEEYIKKTVGQELFEKLNK